MHVCIQPDLKFSRIHLRSLHMQKYYILDSFKKNSYSCCFDVFGKICNAENIYDKKKKKKGYNKQ